MDQATHNKIISFIWGIADDVLRDLFVRGKYRDVILPMFVLRRLDAVLESTKQDVLNTKNLLDDAGITEQRAALCGASGEAFYNTSKFTLRDLLARSNQQQLRADFEAYLDGFSTDVQDILTNFEFRNIIPRLSKADALGTLIAKFLDPEIKIDPSATKIGYEISFTRHFYKPQPLRSLEEIRADILALEQETDGMLAEIVGGTR
jgi:type I restriction enzyme M protein